MTVQILGWPMGNPRSVHNMLNYLNIKSSIIDTPSDLNTSDPLIIPGVGSFDYASHLLDSMDWRTPIHKIVSNNRIVLGICLGMQILCKSSEEGDGNGLRIFDLHLKKFGENEVDQCPRMGWSEITYIDDNYDKLEMNQFYFTHSYRVDPFTNYSIAHANELNPYTCIIRNKSVWGVQFHPEKSHLFGMRWFKYLFAS